MTAPIHFFMSARFGSIVNGSTAFTHDTWAALMLLACFDHLKPETVWGRGLLEYGRVPYFYYLMHVYLIHALAIVVGFVCHQSIAWLWQSTMLATTLPHLAMAMVYRLYM